MPNRQRVIKSLAQDVVGAQVWNGLTGECKTMPTEAYERVEDAMASILERVTRAVDWPRLLEEASWRHNQVHPDYKGDRRPAVLVSGVCGECLAEALLADGYGAPNWEKHPVAPREHGDVDWPAAVADNVKHREAAHWHPYMKRDER